MEKQTAGEDLYYDSHGFYVPINLIVLADIIRDRWRDRRLKLALYIPIWIFEKVISQTNIINR